MTLASRYKTVQVGTASPERVMLMLFEAAARNMRQGRAAYEAKDFSNGGVALEKAAVIVTELQGTLKHEQAPDLCERLHDIYGFVVGRLAMAVSQQNPKFVSEAERAFAPVAEAFHGAAANTQKQEVVSP